MKSKQLDTDYESQASGTQVANLVDESFEVAEDKISSLCDHICGYFSLPPYELSVTFVTPEAIRVINRDYRQYDKTTDVLSFPQYQWEQAWTRQRVETLGQAACLSAEGAQLGPFLLLGDIVISLEQAEQNAHHIGQALDRELCFLLIHGILHLLGHDHMKAGEEELMIAEQKQLMLYLEERAKPPLWKDCVIRKVEDCP